MTAAAMLSACTKFSKLVHWLPTWKLRPSTTRPDAERLVDQVDRLARIAAELGDSSTIEPVLGTRRRSTRPACGA